MSPTGLSLDESPFTRFHLRVTVFTAGGLFCDGYIIGSIGLALPLLTPAMGLGPVWQGAMAASVLVGLFVGALVFGPVTDRFGRQKIYLADLVVFVVASALQFFADGAVTLLILRLVLGIAIGADYAIGGALLAEFAPRKWRGRMMASLNATWTVGFVAAYGVGVLLQGAAGPDAWRWMLASSAVPALITLLLRLGAPESPRWLLGKGRVEEARRVIKTYIGPEYDLDPAEVTAPRSRYRDLFTRRYGRQTFFAGAFYFCQVFPYFAVGIFLPGIITAFGVEDSTLSEIVYNGVLLVGALAGLVLMDRLPRRGFVIWSFFIIGVTLVVLGLNPNGSLAVLLPTLLVLAFVISAAADLESVYPPEIFPTEIRASGVGLATSISRIGAALSTFVLPQLLVGVGVGPTMFVLAGVVAAGFVISLWLAPETRGVGLSAAAGPGPDRPRRVEPGVVAAPEL
ncbi:MFS transporter [Pseudonocardia sp. MH-G8]|uniref:MFS transporter n=1 Tax=Pseudonocardia sp. MH-G8 TaxID=1854588 RepID=UPI000BA0EC54|nr:MFS transporter [Pseudonocardia sp. MH-G8]OZM76495.1 MFS transporter [Pseudonocardia sp. MH-G8]